MTECWFDYKTVIVSGASSGIGKGLVKKLIEDAGALINKGDPRIDTQYRLTMQDLQGMIGEPVWNSNTNTWLLVYDGDWAYAPDPDRVCVRVVNRYGCKDIWLSEEDLIAKPLYRMKAG